MLLTETRYHFVYCKGRSEEKVCTITYFPKRDTEASKELAEDLVNACEGCQHYYWGIDLEDNLYFWEGVEVSGIGVTLTIAGKILTELKANPEQEIQDLWEQHDTCGHDIRLYKEVLQRL